MILVIVVLLLAVGLGLNFRRRMEMCDGRRVCLYVGSGAALAEDVKFALDRLEIPCYEVDENFIMSGKLVECCSVLIMPGGYTATYVSTLAGKGFENIREFVAEGGEYIGICAGAYIAAEIVEVPGHPKGLGIINITNVRRSGMGLVNVKIVGLGDPVVKGYSGVVTMWYQNGPYIIAGEGVDVSAVYEGGCAAIVHSTYGRGKVVIFSTHPEGSLEGGADPEKLGTIKLLENAIRFGKDP